MKYLLSCFVLIFFLLGCDPSRRIEMKNQSGDTAEVIWTVNKDSIGFNPFVIANSKELRFVIPPHNNSDVKMSFGMGNWSQDEVEKLIKRLESLEINSAHRKFKIDSLPQLRDYLMERRKGIDHSKIEILIKE